MKVQSVALASGGKGLFRLGLDQKPAARGIKIELIEPDHLPNALGHFNNLLRSDQGTEALAEWRHFEIVSQNRESPFLKSGFFTPTGKDLWRLSGHVAGEVYGHSIEARETWLKFKGDRADELIWSSANSNATHRLHLAPSAHASLAAKPKP